MEKIVAVVICGAIALSAAGGPAAATNRDDLLLKASHLSGLPVRRVVPQRTLAAPRYDAALSRAADREYPRSLQNIDTALYARLGLVPRSLRAKLASPAHVTRLVRPHSAQTPAAENAFGSAGAGRQQLVRALVDQNFNLRRIERLRVRRPRSRDRCEEHRGRGRCTRFGRE